MRVEDHFESVQPMLEISDGTHYLTLCHYPMLTWNRVSHGSYMIYGHIHNNTGGSYWSLLHQMDQALNAGVDVNRFMPVTFEEMVKIIVSSALPIRLSRNKPLPSFVFPHNSRNTKAARRIHPMRRAAFCVSGQIINPCYRKEVLP